MKLRLVIFVLLFSTCFAKTKIDLLEIYDGDTIKAKINKEEFSIRLIGIDCFETSKNNRAYKQAYEYNIDIEDVLKRGEQAKIYLKKLYSNSLHNIYFDFYGIDKYSRVLGVLYFDNLNINKNLIENNICPKFIYSND